MKKTATILLFLACTLAAHAQYSGSYQELYDSEAVAGMKEHAGFFASAALEGRKAGSEGEKEAAVYFAEVLESYGVDLLYGQEGDVFGLKQENGDTLTSRNVIGFIPGYDRELRDHYIVIAARLDNMGTYSVSVNGEPQEHIYYGGNGNASGLAMLLELARMLQTNKVLLRRSVIIAAFGSSLEGCAGSWYFLNRSFGDVANIDAMINLDMVGTGSNGFYGFSASNADMNQIAVALSSTLQPIQPLIVAGEPVSSDHRMFYDKQIPSMFFTTGMYPEYNTDKDRASILEYDIMEKELEYIYNYSVSLINGLKPVFNPGEAMEDEKAVDKVFPYYECDVKPSFLGSSDPSVFLEKWVYVYMKYPDEAVRNGIQGRVLVDFIIDEKGDVQNARVLRGVDPLLDEAALKVVNASPRWRPAYMRGRKVKSEISMYIEFRLEKKK